MLRLFEAPQDAPHRGTERCRCTSRRHVYLPYTHTGVPSDAGAPAAATYTCRIPTPGYRAMQVHQPPPRIPAVYPHRGTERCRCTSRRHVYLPYSQSRLPHSRRASATYTAASGPAKLMFQRLTIHDETQSSFPVLVEWSGRDTHAPLCDNYWRLELIKIQIYAYV